VRLPLALLLCQSDDVYGYTLLAVSVTVVPTCGFFILSAFRSNVNWPAIIFLIYAYNVWMILLQTTIRTVLLIWSYSGGVVQHHVLPCQLSTSNKTKAFGDIGSGCIAATIVVALLHVFLLCSYMLTDLLKAKGPYLRLLLGSILLVEMLQEVNARSNALILFPQEQERPTQTVFDKFFGETTQQFVLNLDRSVLALLLSGFASTLLRPHACAFILLPCRDSTAMFFFRQDRRTRRLLGMQRYEQLTLSLVLNRNRLRACLRRPGAHCARYLRRLRCGCCRDDDDANAKLSQPDRLSQLSAASSWNGESSVASLAEFTSSANVGDACGLGELEAPAASSASTNGSPAAQI